MIIVIIYCKLIFCQVNKLIFDQNLLFLTKINYNRQYLCYELLSSESEAAMITSTIEDYLKSIYSLENSLDKETPVSTNDIAHSLDVSPSSVTKMVKRLNELGLLIYNSHHGVKLTELGEKLSLSVIRKHRLIELFLQQILNYSWDEVHNEACRLEHCISEKFEDTIDSLLGQPKFDPHGEPIPSKKGVIPEVNAIALAEIKPGNKVKIRWIQNDNPELLKYLEKIGIQPNTDIEVSEVEHFGGTIALHIENMQKWIGIEVAQDIFVTINN